MLKIDCLEAAVGDKLQCVITGYGFGLIHAHAHPAEIRAQRRMAAEECSSRQSQVWGRPVNNALGLATHYLSATTDDELCL